MTENIIGLDQQPFFTPALSPISADAVADAATASRNGTVKTGALAAESIALAVHGDLAAVEPLWRAFETEASHTFFQTFDWLDVLAAPCRRAALRPSRRSSPARTPTARCSSSCRSPSSAAARVRQLTFLGSDLCDYNAPLLHPTFSDDGR